MDIYIKDIRDNGVPLRGWTQYHQYIADYKTIPL